MNYLDANIVIYPILNKDELSKKYKEYFIKIAEGKIQACTSLLTWDEVVHITRKYLGREIAILEGAKFLRLPNLKFIRTDLNIIFKAQELIQKYNLYPRDAIHAATALIVNAAQIVSDDSDFDKIKEIRRVKL